MLNIFDLPTPLRGDVETYNSTLQPFRFLLTTRRLSLRLPDISKDIKTEADKTVTRVCGSHLCILAARLSLSKQLHAFPKMPELWRAASFGAVLMTITFKTIEDSDNIIFLLFLEDSVEVLRFEGMATELC